METTKQDADASEAFEVQGLKLIAVSGGIWRLPPVPSEPHVVLTSWQVFELLDGSRHLLGWCADHDEARVSSCVAGFDVANRSCRTDSGRLYELKGPPGWSRDAQYVWDHWCRMNHVGACLEVTEDVADAMGVRAGEEWGGDR